MNCNSAAKTYNRMNNNNSMNNGNGATTQYGPWGNTYPINPNNPDNPLSVVPPQITIPSTNNQMQNSGQPLVEPIPETLTEYIYTPGFLRSNIGSLMRVEFLIGSNMTDRVGVLSEVGASYIVLESLDQSTSMMCDLYSVKFVTILQTAESRALLGSF